MDEDLQFTPAELNAIEDALEQLEHDGLPLAGAPRVQMRLRQYQDVMTTVRQAWPLEDMPSSLTVESLLAAARSSAGESDALHVAVPLVGETSDSWWTRLRKGFLVPTLAVTASCVLVLLMLRPGSDAQPDLVATKSLDVPAPATPTFEAEPAAEQAMPAGTPALDDTRAMGDEKIVELATTQSPPPAPPAAAAKPASAVEGKTRGDVSYGGAGATADAMFEGQGTKSPGAGPMAKKALAGKGKAPAAEPAPSRSPASERSQLEQADTARRADDCETAARLYRVLKQSTDDTIAARAYAGLGFCASQAGSTATAEDYFIRAQDLDPSVSSELGRESNSAQMSRRTRSQANRKAKPASPQREEADLNAVEAN